MIILKKNVEFLRDSGLVFANCKRLLNNIERQVVHRTNPAIFSVCPRC